MAESYEFLVVWRYIVKPEHKAEFEQAYGEDGEWVRLFRKSAGYIRTELMKSGESAREYMTIDHWESADAFNDFTGAYAAEYEQLDKRMGDLTDSERLVGWYLREREA